MQLQNIVILILGVFILYRIFMRVRRSIGWQRLNPGKMQVLTAIFFIFGLIFLIEGVFHPVSLISDAAGILIGAILAYYGSAMTRFEHRDGRLYYRTSTWIGSIVTVVFLGRVIYRVYEMFISKNGGLEGGNSLTDRLASIGYSADAPWTSGLMLIMLAYYIIYYIILLRKKKRLL